MSALQLERAVLILVSLVMLEAPSVADQVFVDVSHPNCPGTGTASDPFCKIQDAIDAATTGDEVLVAPGFYFENLDVGDKSIHLRAVSPGTVIDGGQQGSVVRFQGQTGPGAILEGFGITNGNGTQLSGGGRYGGGLLIRGAAPTIRRCEIYNNTANYGGAVNCGDIGSSPRFESCMVSNNNAWIGGGFYFEYCDESAIKIIGTLIENNHANEGGALFSNVTTLEIINCTVSRNFASSGAGLVLSFSHFFERPVTVANCILWNNQVDEIVLLGPPYPVTVGYSIVRGGWPGPGNLDTDPLFRSGGYELSRQSPAIDAGSNRIRTELPALDLEARDLRILDTVDMGSDEFGLEWELNGPAISGGPPVDFSAYAGCGQVGTLAEIFLSRASPFQPCGYGRIDLPDSHGRFLDLSSTPTLSSWLALPSTLRQVPLNGCVGARTRGMSVPAGIAPGTQFCFQGLSWDPLSGRILSVSHPDSFVVQ